MKNIIFLVTILLLTSCDLDSSIDSSLNDSDDVNLIKKVWKQSLDKAIELYDTNTSAS